MPSCSRQMREAQRHDVYLKLPAKVSLLCRKHGSLCGALHCVFQVTRGEDVDKFSYQQASCRAGRQHGVNYEQQKCLRTMCSIESRWPRAFLCRAEPQAHMGAG